MKFVLKPSLEHLSLVQIGISLWNQNDVRTLISKLDYCDLFLLQGGWVKIEERVTKKVPQLPIPHLLKEKVFGVIKPIGMQIFKWMKYYHKYDVCIECRTSEFLHFSELHLPGELCWTSHGTVDRKRTAEVLVRDENLNVSRRYILACDYFLEGDVIKFWNRLPGDFKDYDWNDYPVVCFWSENMKRDGLSPISYKNAFQFSIRDNNKVAGKYFLQKLTPHEREECLKELTIYLKDADVFLFLLSEMEDEEQKKVLKSDPLRVLLYFLQWPFQSFLIGVANVMWDFLSKSSYDELLGCIIHKVKEGCKDYDYQNLFRVLWQERPHATKDAIIDEIDNCWLLESLFEIKDKENIRLIFKDATLTTKEKLITSDVTYFYLTFFICKNEWDFPDFFIREFFPSKREVLKFKEEFEKEIYFNGCSATEKHKHHQFFASLMTSFAEDEGESNSSKEFQSTVTHT